MPTIPLPLVGPDYADETAIEEWKAIPGYEGAYEASSLGRVRSLERVVVMRDGVPRPVRAKVLAQKVMNKSYRGVSLSRGKRQQTFLVHRLVMLAFSGYSGHVDHADRDGANNALLNLRPATRKQNQANQGVRKNNTSGFKGVSWCRKSQKWTARILLDRRYAFLGSFRSPLDAARAYDRKRLGVSGPFACLNLGGHS